VFLRFASRGKTSRFSPTDPLSLTRCDRLGWFTRPKWSGGWWSVDAGGAGIPADKELYLRTPKSVVMTVTFRLP